MKRTVYISFLFCTLILGCTREETDTIDDGQLIHKKAVLLQSMQEDSRATYDNALLAEWEVTDKIKMVQGCATFGDSYAGILEFDSYQDASSKNKASFKGNVLVSSPNNNYYHFTYPESGSLSVQDWTTTLVQTIPASQNGKWIPYMYASTKSNEDGLDNISASFKAINGALGIQLYELFDYTTPKTISSVTIEASKNIVGSYTITATKGNPLSGGELSNGSSTISASGDLEYTEGPEVSYYEYRLNALPEDELTLEITINDGSENRSFIAEGVKIEAGKITRLRIAWQSAEIVVDEPTSWYEKIAGLEIESGSEVKSTDGTTLLGSTIYATGIDWKNIPESAEKGIIVDGVKYPGVFSKGELTSGAHTICAYAELTSGNSTKLIKSEEKEVIVTPIVTIELGELSSWYTESAGGATSPTEGGVVNVKNGIRSSISADLISVITPTCKFRYNNGAEADGTLNADSSFTIQDFHTDGDYSVKGAITFQNGATITSVAKTITVTKRFSVEFTENALDSWYNDINDERNREGQTLYITSTITSDASGEFTPTEKYYTYWKEGSSKTYIVKPNNKNTCIKVLSISNGKKIAESTTSVIVEEGNGIYNVDANIKLNNGAIVTSQPQKIDVTEIFTTSITDNCTNSWYKSQGSYANGNELYVKGTITSTATGTYLPTNVYYTYNIENGSEIQLSGDTQLNKESTHTATTSTSGKYFVKGHAILPNGKHIYSAAQNLYITKKFSINKPQIHSWYSSDSNLDSMDGSKLYLDSTISVDSPADFTPSVAYRLYTANGTFVREYASSTTTIPELATGDYYITSYAKFPYEGPEITSTSNTIDVTPRYSVSMTSNCNSWYKSKGALDKGNTLYIENGVITTTAPTSGNYAPSTVYYEYNMSGGSVSKIISSIGTRSHEQAMPSGNAADGLYLIRAKVELPQNHRSSIKVLTSNEESLYITQKFTLTSATISSWFHNTAKSTGNTIYVDGTSSSTMHDSFLSGATVTYEYSGASTGSISSSIGGNAHSKAVDNGDYTVKMKAILPFNGPTIYSNSTQISVTDKPDLNTTIQSSYSNNGNTAPTNDLDGSTIYFRAGTLVNKGTNTEIDAYSKSKLFTGSNNVTYYCDDSHKNTYSNSLGAVQYTGLTWQQYNCYVSVNLNNGYNIKKTYTTHVTGLPRRFTPPQNVEKDTFDKWTQGSWNVKNESNYVQIGGVSGSGECSITYKSFYIPADTQVNVYTQYRAKSLYWGISYQRTTYSVTIGTTSTNIYTTPKDKDEHTGTSDTVGTLTSNNRNIKLDSSYKVAGPWVRVYDVYITYK